MVQPLPDIHPLTSAAARAQHAQATVRRMQGQLREVGERVTAAERRALQAKSDYENQRKAAALANAVPGYKAAESILPLSVMQRDASEAEDTLSDLRDAYAMLNGKLRDARTAVETTESAKAQARRLACREQFTQAALDYQAACDNVRMTLARCLALAAVDNALAARLSPAMGFFCLPAVDRMAPDAGGGAYANSQTLHATDVPKLERHIAGELDALEALAVPPPDEHIERRSPMKVVA